ncbi:hypothetical protein DICPUDRAFT_149800 [Dictyostelium purpureum]|uniref:Uncharacterized protein n=1 Tax=Dictyostelium purpureum TaxID=5786 RepID=F0ZEP8_DICPU|nr:uncharacterized protein DICPUDRAFT_149800 [Dictyostelium purpureum]EGC37564.1 hypothetical protein DICPUDRAFT_149800 [Dictyostelium purpureum]|eukprot:XP_003285890.1 hypothetical protein DICPUDRAFT_149800 [Dictyostelium purpureum]
MSKNKNLYDNSGEKKIDIKDEWRKDIDKQFNKDKEPNINPQIDPTEGIHALEEHSHLFNTIYGQK